MKTLAPEFTIQDDFPPVGYDEWRALVDESLAGAPFERKLVTHTYEGIDIQPIYSRRDQGVGDLWGFPGLPPFVRGGDPLGATVRGWDVRPEHAHPDLAVTNRAILEDLEGGATSLLLRLDSAACRGLDPDHDAATELAGHAGIMAYEVDDLAAVLAEVQLEMVAVTLDAGGAFLPAAAILAALWQRRNVSPKAARGAFNADPLATLAREGLLPVAASQALAQLAELAAWTAAEYPHVTAVGVDTSPYHEAGATAAQDIAFALATAVEYLRSMTKNAGTRDAETLDVNGAAQQILFRLSLGTHHFLALAKLRAARGLWARVVQACGGSPAAAPMRIDARTSNRVLTRRDPHVNLLRNTVAVFAAGLGGADAITSVPFDTMTGLPDSFSRRVARNTVLVLQEEAHLHRPVDPAGGSWFLDQLTAQLAETAWEVFQETERQGGMLAALQSGWVASQIDAAYRPRAKDIASRKQGITGVSEFPNVSEEQVTTTPPDTGALRKAAATRVAAARQDLAAASAGAAPEINSPNMAWTFERAGRGATIGQLATAWGFEHHPAETMPRLESRSFAEPFEELRDASDAWQATHGQRPRIFLANMGPIAHDTARATYAKNFFEAGGFEVISNDGFKDAEAAAEAFVQSGAKLAVICSSDRLYEELVSQVAPQLKQAGARSVILAGQPGANLSAWQSAGVDRFIFVKCDVLATLRELLCEEGVLERMEN